MLTTLTVKDFSAVPYLETSTLMQTHQGSVHFSKRKANVVVGPNGSGKSALLKALALYHLAFFTNQSTFDHHYVVGRDSEAWWTKKERWRHDYLWLDGLKVTGDDAPALYYRPAHLPGNETSVAHAMMTGYFEEARAYAELTEDKSSGQQAQALLHRLMRALQGVELPTTYRFAKAWRFGREAREFEQPYQHSNYEHQAEALKRKFLPAANGLPLVLMDEPEQSLDALAQASLWTTLARADTSKVQVIVATHSLYPLLHPEHFNLVETVPGYSQSVLAALA